MASAAEIYADELHDNFQVMYAAWPPGEPLRLGDYGPIRGNLFVRIGNITSDEKIAFESRHDPTRDQWEYKSAGSVALAFRGGGKATVSGAAKVRAGLTVRFSKEDAVFFNAAECSLDSIEDQVAVGKAILKLFERKQWDGNNAIITHVVDSLATTVAISSDQKASISLEATGDAPNIDLADASIRFSVKAERNVGYKVISKDGLTPLIGLSKIQPKHPWPFSGIKFGPTRRLLPERILDTQTLRAAVDEKGAPLEDVFFFGDLR